MTEPASGMCGTRDIPAVDASVSQERSQTPLYAPQLRTWLRSPRTLGGKSMAVDPICKMEVDPRTAKWKSVHRGKEYFFCAPGCKAAFDKEPERYV